jgi:hypothetical protein
VSPHSNSQEEFHTPSRPEPTTPTSPNLGPDRDSNPLSTRRVFNQAIADTLLQGLDLNKPKDANILQKIQKRSRKDPETTRGHSAMPNQVPDQRYPVT